MELRLAVVVIVMIPGTQLEDVGQGGEEEEQHLEHQLFSSSISDEERQQPENLDFDQLDHKNDGEESQEQLVLENFLCKNSEIID